MTLTSAPVSKRKSTSGGKDNLTFSVTGMHPRKSFGTGGHRNGKSVLHRIFVFRVEKWLAGKNTQRRLDSIIPRVGHTVESGQHEQRKDQQQSYGHDDLQAFGRRNQSRERCEEDLERKR